MVEEWGRMKPVMTPRESATTVAGMRKRRTLEEDCEEEKRGMSSEEEEGVGPAEEEGS